MLARPLKLLGICEKERLRFFSVSSLFFILLMSWSLANCARTAIFMKAAGPGQLPYMYVVNAALMLIAAGVYGRIVDRVARHRFLVLYLIASAALFSALRILIPLNQAWMPYVLYSFANVSYTILFMHLWTFANDIFDPREAKRLFPLIGAVSSVAGVAGGFLTKLAVGAVGTPNLLLLWAAVLIAAIPVALWVNRIALDSGALAPAGAAAGDEEPMEGFLEGLSSLWAFPLVRALASIALPMGLIVTAIDFQYYLALDSVFKEQDQLTAFLGLFNSVTLVSGFALQLLVTGRLLKRFGAGETFLAYPLSLTSGAAALAARSLLPVPAAPTLLNAQPLSAVYAKFSDNAISSSIAGSSSQLLYNALPADKRGRGRAFISGTTAPICTALAGGILILMKAAKIPLWTISFSLVGLGALLILLASRLKSAYLKTLVENMGSQDMELRLSAMNLLAQMKDAKTVAILIDALSSPNEEAALFALELLKAASNDRMAAKFCDALPQALPKVKVALLRALALSGRRPATAQALMPLLEDASPDIRAAAVRAIGETGNRAQRELLAASLDDESIDVRAEACIAVIRANLGLALKIRAVEKLRDMASGSSSATHARAAYVIGEVHFRRLLSAILGAAASNDDLLRREAFRAVGKIADAETVPQLVKLMDEGRLAVHAEKTIVSMGEIAVEPLHREIGRPDNSPQRTVHLISCLRRLGKPASIPFLAGILRQRPRGAVLDAAVDALAAIKERAARDGAGAADLSKRLTVPVLTVLSQCLSSLVAAIQEQNDCLDSLRLSPRKEGSSLVNDALIRSKRRSEATAFKCLEFFAPAETIASAAAQVRTGESRLMAEAFEVLEGSCAESRPLVRALENGYFPDSSERPRLSPAKTLARLSSRENPPWLRASAIHAIGELRIVELKSALIELLEDEDRESLVHGNAVLALRKMGYARDEHNQEADRMAATMQRTLFLRSVPLFSAVEGGDLQWIAEIAEEKEFKPDEVVYRENDEGASLYVILSGSVRVMKGVAKPVMLSILQERDYFGEMAVLGRERRPTSVEAQLQTKLLAIHREDFQRLLLARPKIAFALLRSLAAQTQELQQEVLNAKNTADWFMKKSSLKPAA